MFVQREMVKKVKQLMDRKEYDRWLEKLPKGVCTFCEWEKYQILLKEFKHWVWIANIAPYWKYHTMIISKRHFEKYAAMTPSEAEELGRVIDYGGKKIIDSKLCRDDGSLIEKVVYFWRFRVNNFDMVSGTVRPTHFHVHLVQDRDHLWDPIIKGSACDWEVNCLR